MNGSAVPKSIRFEVFKRDSFACQYCGRKAPDAILECDHIEARANGGNNDPLNLITACDACNRGKSSKSLDDCAIINKRRVQLEKLNERRELLRMMFEWSTELEGQDAEAIDRLRDHFNNRVPGCFLSESGLMQLKQLYKKYAFDDILSAVRECCDKYVRYENGKISSESVELAWTKITAALSWGHLPDDKKKLLYIRGIIRNRHYCNEKKAIILLNEAYKLGAPLRDLEEMAKVSANWTAWSTSLEEFIRRRA